MAVFDQSGRLIYIGRESNVLDDLGTYAEINDLSKGSAGNARPVHRAGAAADEYAATTWRSCPMTACRRFSATTSTPARPTSAVGWSPSTRSCGSSRITSAGSGIPTASKTPPRPAGTPEDALDPLGYWTNRVGSTDNQRRQRRQGAAANGVIFDITGAADVVDPRGAVHASTNVCVLSVNMTSSGLFIGNRQLLDPPIALTTMTNNAI